MCFLANLDFKFNLFCSKTALFFPYFDKYCKIFDTLHEAFFTFENVLQIRELEHEVENEQRRRTDSEKLMRKQERRIKEITFSADEDRKTHDDMRDSIEKLNAKVKQLKRMLEEAVSLHHILNSLKIISFLVEKWVI